MRHSLIVVEIALGRWAVLHHLRNWCTQLRASPPRKRTISRAVRDEPFTQPVRASVTCASFEPGLSCSPNTDTHARSRMHNDTQTPDARCNMLSALHLPVAELQDMLWQHRPRPTPTKRANLLRKQRRVMVLLRPLFPVCRQLPGLPLLLVDGDVRVCAEPMRQRIDRQAEASRHRSCRARRRRGVEQ